MPGFDSILGTANAWKYTGSLDVQGLFQAGTDLVAEYKSRFHQTKHAQLSVLFAEADGLFRRSYVEDPES
jgi:hypothetical protein